MAQDASAADPGDTPDKAKSKSVSLPPSMWDEVEAYAAEHHGGNRSAYLRLLYERDKAERAKRRSPVSPTILEDLARVYIPTRADQLIDELVKPGAKDPAAAINQPVVMEQLLVALLRALKVKDFEPELPFDLADKARVEKWESDSEARLGALAEMLAARLGKGNVLPFVAEEQAPFDSQPKPKVKKPPPPSKAG